MAEHLLVLLSPSLPERLEDPRTRPHPLGLPPPSAAQWGSEGAWQVWNERERGGEEGRDAGGRADAEGRALVVVRGEGDGEIWDGEMLEAGDWERKDMRMSERKGRRGGVTLDGGMCWRAVGREGVWPGCPNVSLDLRVPVVYQDQQAHWRNDVMMTSVIYMYCNTKVTHPSLAAGVRKVDFPAP